MSLCPHSPSDLPVNVIESIKQCYGIEETIVLRIVRDKKVPNMFWAIPQTEF